MTYDEWKSTPIMLGCENPRCASPYCNGDCLPDNEDNDNEPEYEDTCS